MAFYGYCGISIDSIIDVCYGLEAGRQDGGISVMRWGKEGGSGDIFGNGKGEGCTMLAWPMHPQLSFIIMYS